VKAGILFGSIENFREGGRNLCPYCGDPSHNLSIQGEDVVGFERYSFTTPSRPMSLLFESLLSFAIRQNATPASSEEDRTRIGK
jgi:hypothetical protein